VSLRNRKRPIEDRWYEFWRRFQAGRWEPETRELLERFLFPGDLFVDIGAWIGPVTTWALDCGAEVIAVEPDPIACGELRRRHGDHIEIWEGAITPEPGWTYVKPQGDLGDSMTQIRSDGDVAVEGFTLDEVLNGRIPALVKVDIEGYETKLLPTLAPYLATLGVPLVVALHDKLPDPAWFAGYDEVSIPDNPRDNFGHSTQVIAR
jgi:FkbM family methyltransferase